MQLPKLFGHFENWWSNHPMKMSLLSLALCALIVNALTNVGKFTNLAAQIVALQMMVLIPAHLFGFLLARDRDAIRRKLSGAASSIRTWLQEHRQDIVFYALVFTLLGLYCATGFAQVRIPGSDESAKLKAAGTLLMLMDTALFVWLARIFAGLCVLSAGWLIKEQKFGPAVVCVLGALVIGTSPMWVQNIFEIGGGGGVFK